MHCVILYIKITTDSLCAASVFFFFFIFLVLLFATRKLINFIENWMEMACVRYMCVCNVYVGRKEEENKRK